MTTRTMALVAAAVTAACSGTRTAPPAPVLGAPVDRIGRPLTANMLIGPAATEEVSDRRKEQYNRAAQADWPQFVADIQGSLGFYDGFDGACGNQWLADGGAEPAARYLALARTLADDRLWVDTTATVCTSYLAVERGERGERGACGGRPPTIDAIDPFRSLLVGGATTGIDDGVDADDHVHSASEFPFLAAP